MARLFSLLGVIIVASFFCADFNALGNQLKYPVLLMEDFTPSEKSLLKIAVDLADKQHSYQEAIAVMLKIKDSESRSFLEQYIPLSAAGFSSAEVFLGVANEVGAYIVVRQLSLESIEEARAVCIKHLIMEEAPKYVLKISQDSDGEVGSEKVVYALADAYLMVNSTKRRGAAIFAQRGLFEENIKIIKEISDRDEYSGAVTNGAIEIMSGSRKHPEKLDAYLENFDYYKLKKKYKLDFSGGIRYADAYSHGDRRDKPAALAIFDDPERKNFVTFVVLEQ